MNIEANYFNRFEHATADIARPTRFTFPFYYDVHPLARLAAEQLQVQLGKTPGWNALFGLTDTLELATQQPQPSGKMFGVLVVESPQGELGFLSAFSGKIQDSNRHAGFVPPVYDMLDDNGFFRSEYQQVKLASEELSSYTKTCDLPALKQQLSNIIAQSNEQIKQLQSCIAGNRKRRKQQRTQGQTQLSATDYASLEADLAKQSVADKNQLKWLKLEWADKRLAIEQQVQAIENRIDQLRHQRALLSNQLQHKIFAHYSFLNAKTARQDLNQIFAATPYKVPPAGAGECAAPKLMQYAYLHKLKPIALAEFWWGHSPKSEIRQHKQYYPSCMSKCHPILSHMLDGLDVDPNPLLNNPGQDKPLPIIYADEHIVVVDKPEGFLSVPGRHIKDSALTRLQQSYPDCDGPFALHRLDMATSGLLVFALTRRANKHLQHQFISRQVKKRYAAIIEGKLDQLSCDVQLPLCADPYDRPRQMVSFDQGKPAHTRVELIETKQNRSTVYLYPKTGRTHQLRVHCAHNDGLAMPIVGDTLYGTKSDRLYLHAQQLSFVHPITKQWVTFEAPIPF